MLRLVSCTTFPNPKEPRGPLIDLPRVSFSSTSHLKLNPNSPRDPHSILHCSSIRSQPKLVHSSSHSVSEMQNSTETAPSPSIVKLAPIEATPESFHGFGQVIEASPDGETFGPKYAQLDLSHGIPRFYIMHIEDRPLKFSTITHHASVTQCLGSIGGHVWYLGVAKPSIVDPIEIKGTMGADVVESRCGHFYIPPAVEDVRIFRFSGSKFVKLNQGTWHAGPLFEPSAMDFYNLELSNTNEVDHTLHNFAEKNNVVFICDEHSEPPN